MKHQAIVENRRVAEVVRRALALLDIEEAIEEVLVELDADTTRYRIEGLAQGVQRGEVLVYLDLDRECRLEKIVDNTVIRILCRRAESNIHSVYKSVALELSTVSVELLRHYVNRGVEYMALVLDQGVVIVVEGFQDRVVIPRVPGTLFVCHTHPNTLAPVFSEKDVAVLLDVLSNRGFGACVISSTACLTIYRYGFFVAEDYFKLLRLARERRGVDLEALRTEGFRSLDGFTVPI